MASLPTASPFKKRRAKETSIPPFWVFAAFAGEAEGKSLAECTRLFAPGLPTDYFLDSSHTLCAKERRRKACALEAADKPSSKSPARWRLGEALSRRLQLSLVCNGEVRTIGRRQRKAAPLAHPSNKRIAFPRDAP